MLRVEQQTEKFSGPFAKVRTHHFNYGSPGEQPEKVWQVIRGGGHAKLTVGAEVMGHGHVHPAFKDQIRIGEQEVYYTKDGRAVTVKLEQIEGLPSGPASDMIKQDGEDELGYLYMGTVVALEVPLKKTVK